MDVLANGVGAAALSLHRIFVVLYPCLAMQSMGEMKNILIESSLWNGE
ncbi:hypothetical protein JNB91_12880 [Rhizobium wenxiniae]|nr:hypothetical protein [Rhizobium wenxiniae]MBW9088740.1 hypothetical protein [Rhizobium wenxiniae]